MSVLFDQAASTSYNRTPLYIVPYPYSATVTTVLVPDIFQLNWPIEDCASAFPSLVASNNTFTLSASINITGNAVGLEVRSLCADIPVRITHTSCAAIRLSGRTTAVTFDNIVFDGSLVDPSVCGTAGRVGVIVNGGASAMFTGGIFQSYQSVQVLPYETLFGSAVVAGPYDMEPSDSSPAISTIGSLNVTSTVLFNNVGNAVTVYGLTQGVVAVVTDQGPRTLVVHLPPVHSVDVICACTIMNATALLPWNGADPLVSSDPEITTITNCNADNTNVAVIIVGVIIGVVGTGILIAICIKECMHTGEVHHDNIHKDVSTFYHNALPLPAPTVPPSDAGTRMRRKPGA